MKKVCLLIHGYISDNDDFGKLPSVLKKYYDEVVICKLPGHDTYGRIYQFTFKDTVDALHEVIETYIKDAVVDLIGYSLGGVMAMYFAKQFVFHKVVLLSPSIKFLNPKFPKTFKNYIHNLADTLDPEIASEATKKLKEQVKTDFKYIYYRFETRFTFSTLKTFMQFVIANEKLKEKMKSPLLIMRGELDELVPRDVVDTIMDCCDNVNKQFIPLPSSGHLFLRFEEQDEIIDKIVQFLIKED